MNNFFTITKPMCNPSKLLVVTLCVPLLSLSALSASAQAPDIEVLSADDYNATVTQLESSNGPYAVDLAEPLQGLGRALAKQGDYIGAEKAYKRAIHLTRINQGLYSSRQIPLLRALVEVNLSAGRWDQVNDGYGHMEWLYRQAFSRGEPLAYTDGLSRISDWHLSVAGLDMAQKRRGHLLKANSINQLAVKAGKLEYGSGDARLVPSLYRLALSHYYLALSLATDVEVRLLEQPNPFSVPRSQSARLSDSVDMNIAEVNRHLRGGRQALRRIQSIYAASSDAPAAQAEAMAAIYLADWELLSAKVRSFTQGRYLRSGPVRQSASFGAVKRAVGQYQGARNQLLALGLEPAAIQAYFERPVALPLRSFSPVLDTGKNTGDGADGDYEMEFVSWSPVLFGVGFPGDGLLLPLEKRLAQTTASLTIDALGRAARIEFVERDPAVRLRSRAREEIKAIQFRPATNGEAAIASPPLRLRYKFISS